MTVKIIQPPAAEYKAVCHRCGCIFTYELSDLSRQVFTSATQCVKCPVCDETYLHPNQRKSSGDQ